MRDPASPAGAAASDRAGQGDSPSWPSYSCQLSRPRGRRSAPLPAGARAALKGGSAGPVRVSRSAAAARSEERHGAAAGLLSTGARAAGGTVSAGRAHQPPRRGGRAGLRRGARHTGSKRASWGAPPDIQWLPALRAPRPLEGSQPGAVAAPPFPSGGPCIPFPAALSALSSSIVSFLPRGSRFVNELGGRRMCGSRRLPEIPLPQKPHCPLRVRPCPSIQIAGALVPAGHSSHGSTWQRGCTVLSLPAQRGA